VKIISVPDASQDGVQRPTFCCDCYE